MTPEEKQFLDESLPRWGLEEKPMDEVTVKDLEELCDAAFKRERTIEAMAAELDEQKEARDAILERVKRYITHFGKTNYESAHGTIEIRSKLSFKTPKTAEQKEAFFNWLKEKGVFWEYVSVNSNSLNSLCKQEYEAAKESGTEPLVPGIEAPTEWQTMAMRKKK